MDSLKEKILDVFTEWRRTAESMRRDNQSLNDGCIELIRESVEAAFDKAAETITVDPIVKKRVLAVFGAWKTKAAAMLDRRAQLNDNCIEDIRKDVEKAFDGEAKAAA